MSKTDWKENNLYTLFSERNLWPQKKVESILDVACGLSLKSKYLPADIRVGVDIYEEYFKHIESIVPYVVVKYDVRKLEEIFQPKSFDVVIACDILEHLEKAEALEMIRQCERIASQAVIFETPEGFIPQNIDILGYGGDQYQTHRSGWSEQELKDLGYTTFTRPYQMTDVKRHTELEVGTSINLINAIKYV